MGQEQIGQWGVNSWWVLCAFVVVLASNVAAQSPPTIEQRAAAADVVVAGSVVELVTTPTGPSGQPGIHTRVVVERGARSSLVEFWVHGGTLGNQRRVVTGQPTFELGERVVLFLFRTPDGILWPTHRGKLNLAGRVGAQTVALPSGSHIRFEDLWARVRDARQHRSDQ